MEEVELYLTKEGDKWKVDDAQLEALLSLVSHSAWRAEQNWKHRETDREKSPARFKSSIYRFENSQSIDRFRAKAAGQIYQHVVGKSSPKLLSDLSWWMPNTEEVLNEVKCVDEYKRNRVVAVSTHFPFNIKTAEDKVIEQPALGFYLNDESLGENGMLTTSVLCREY